MLSMLWLLLIPHASGELYSVDEKCRDVADPDNDGIANPPADYSEAEQNNFLMNFYSLATTFSPLHGPIPHKPGTGSLGVELAGMPFLSCERRLVLNYTKTEDTNKTPVVPRPRGLFAFPAKTFSNGISLVPYAGFGYVPPIPLGGTRNVIVSVEAGAGLGNLELGGIQYGVRYHATLMRTIGEVATPFVGEGENKEDLEVYEDLYIGSTFGLDFIAGYQMTNVTPYLSVGWTDVSTVFYIDDDAIMANNSAPYAGPVFSLGAQGSPKEFLDLAGEFYAAPVSFYIAGDESISVTTRSGSIYTGRVRIAYQF